MFKGKEIIVLDLEVLNSPDEVPTGWNDKKALGLSIGAYWDYRDMRMHWFDRSSLLRTVDELTERSPLMVSFNGISFDFALMRALLRYSADMLPETVPSQDITDICDRFKALAVDSYDILREVWAVDAAGKFTKGLNSLGAICEANGIGQKSGDGAQAPKDWQAGRYADVMNYCSDDVYLTKALLERASENHGKLLRNGPGVTIRHLDVSGQWCGAGPCKG